MPSFWQLRALLLNSRFMFNVLSAMLTPMRLWLITITLFLLATPALHAQSEEDDSKRDLAEEIDDLRDEVRDLRDKLKRESDLHERDNIRADRMATLYGDVGLRWQYVFTDGERSNNTPGGNDINRPEFRVRMGIAGFVFDSEKHRFKYDVRVSNVGMGEFDAPLGAPTVGWRPFDAFGSSSDIFFDRWHINHTYKRFLRVGGGKFGSIMKGQQLIFDHDLGLTGAYGIFDIGVAFRLYERRPIDDWLSAQPSTYAGVTHVQIRTALYYLGQENLGFPNTTAERLPHGFSLQVPTKAWLSEPDTSVLVAPGFHYFEGEEGIATNIGTGNTSSTTSTLKANGLPNSQYRIGDLYFQLTFLEDRIASAILYAHIAKNFASEAPTAGSAREGEAMILGVEWGALKLEERGDFRLSYSFQYIEADVTIPEFNHDVYNTNYTGHSFSLQVNLLPKVTIFASLFMGHRIDQSTGGVGRRSDGLTGNPSDDKETRVRAGIVARF